MERAAFARGQTALRDGVGHAAAIDRINRPRRGHVRLRPANAAGAKWHRFHGWRGAQPEERRGYTAKGTNRGWVRVSGVPGGFARVYPPSGEVRGNSRVAPDHPAQPAFLPRSHEPDTPRDRGWHLC